MKYKTTIKLGRENFYKNSRTGQLTLVIPKKKIGGKDFNPSSAIIHFEKEC